VKKTFEFFVRHEEEGIPLLILLFVVLTLADNFTHISTFIWLGVCTGLFLSYIFLEEEIHHFKETHVWKCSSCGEQGWDPKESFCYRCGGKMVWEKITPEFCPNGHEVKPYHTFCPKCGAPLKPKSPTKKT